MAPPPVTPGCRLLRLQLERHRRRATAVAGRACPSSRHVRRCREYIPFFWFSFKEADAAPVPSVVPGTVWAPSTNVMSLLASGLPVASLSTALKVTVLFAPPVTGARTPRRDHRPTSTQWWTATSANTRPTNLYYRRGPRQPVCRQRWTRVATRSDRNEPSRIPTETAVARHSTVWAVLGLNLQPRRAGIATGARIGPLGPRPLGQPGRCLHERRLTHRVTHVWMEQTRLRLQRAGGASRRTSSAGTRRSTNVLPSSNWP